MDENKFIIEVEAEPTTVQEKLTFEDPIPHLEETEDRTLNVRLDKWLWAARFYKTRALARSAVKNGKVFYNGQKATPSREIEIGDTVVINQTNFDRIVIIKALSTRRRSAEEAQKLYDESTKQNQGTPSEHSNVFTKTSHEDAFNESTSKSKRVVRFLRRAFLRSDEVKTSVPSEN